MNITNDTKDNYIDECAVKLLQAFISAGYTDDAFIIKRAYTMVKMMNRERMRRISRESDILKDVPEEYKNYIKNVFDAIESEEKKQI